MLNIGALFSSTQKFSLAYGRLITLQQFLRKKSLSFRRDFLRKFHWFSFFETNSTLTLSVLPFPARVREAVNANHAVIL